MDNTLNTNSHIDIDTNNIPVHIAVIMDGNGRWARQRKMNRLQGHHQGYKTLKNIVIAAANIGVKILTAYTFSSENWTRPDHEVAGLMRLIRFAARAELDEMKKEGVKIVVSGRMHELPKSVQKQLQQDINETKDSERIVLNIAVNYGGRNEIIDATRNAAKMVLEGKIKVEDINEKLISSFMYHPELPDPDLMIRTAGEMRISNFLLWECAYTEFYSTPTLWPDFDENELKKAIADYQKRTRKFGAVVE